MLALTLAVHLSKKSTNLTDLGVHILNKTSGNQLIQNQLQFAIFTA